MFPQGLNAPVRMITLARCAISPSMSACVRVSSGASGKVVRTNAASLVPAYNAQIRQLAAGRLNVHVLDLEPIMRNRAYVGNDGLHLTDAGFEVMASAFMAAIETAFPVRGSFQ